MDLETTVFEKGKGESMKHKLKEGRETFFPVLIGLLAVVILILLISAWVLPTIKQESFCPDCIDIFPLLGILALIVVFGIFLMFFFGQAPLVR